MMTTRDLTIWNNIEDELGIDDSIKAILDRDTLRQNAALTQLTASDLTDEHVHKLLAIEFIAEVKIRAAGGAGDAFARIQLRREMRTDAFKEFVVSLQTPTRKLEEFRHSEFVVETRLGRILKRFAVEEKYFPKKYRDRVMNCTNVDENASTDAWAKLCQTQFFAKVKRTGTSKSKKSATLSRRQSRVEIRGKGTRVSRAFELKAEYEKRYRNADNNVESREEDAKEGGVKGVDTHLHLNATGDKPDVTFFETGGRVVMFLELMREKGDEKKHLVDELFRFLVDYVLTSNTGTHLFGILCRGTTAYTVVCFCRDGETWKIWMSPSKNMYSPKTQRCFANIVLSILTSSPHSLGVFDDFDGWTVKECVGIGGECYALSVERVSPSDVYEESKLYVAKFYKSRRRFDAAEAAYGTLRDKLGYVRSNKDKHCFDIPYAMDRRRCCAIFDLLYPEVGLVSEEGWVKLAEEMSRMLHKRKYIHRDACAPNILWDSELERLRLTDVGSLCKLEEKLESLLEHGAVDMGTAPVVGASKVVDESLVVQSVFSGYVTHSGYVQPDKEPINAGYDQVSILKSVFKLKLRDMCDDGKLTHVHGPPLSVEEFCTRVRKIFVLSDNSNQVGSATQMASVNKLMATNLNRQRKPRRLGAEEVQSRSQPARRAKKKSRLTDGKTNGNSEDTSSSMDESSEASDALEEFSNYQRRQIKVVAASVVRQRRAASAPVDVELEAGAMDVDEDADAEMEETVTVATKKRKRRLEAVVPQSDSTEEEPAEKRQKTEEGAVRRRRRRKMSNV